MGHSTTLSDRSKRLLRRVLLPALTLVTVCSGTVVFASRPATGDSITSARQRAASIEAALNAAQNEMSALSQQYDEAASRLSGINSNIATTKATITADEKQVAGDRQKLSKAAIANYVTDGASSAENPIFGGNQATAGAATEYNRIAEGDLTLAVANLHTAEDTLNAQEAQLSAQQGQAQQQVNVEQAAISHNEQEIQAQQNALASENGVIANLIQQQQEAQVRASTRLIQTASSRSSDLAGLNNAAPPPTAAGGAGAVQAAESQIGVPYVWGGESPRGSSDPGFDCSGLTAWSWGQVGVSLPHFSGGQMSDTTRVPLSDLQPGDLLFYGPGGDTHVAMYVGPGTMIEAPQTGESVHLTGIRLGDGFVGAGRP